tara:strand:- start:1906 stop:2334 length:429 start_codon:yes stop_codon:yes gene_type:complete
MNKTSDKLTLYIATIISAICLLVIICFTETTTIDKTYIILVLISQFLLIYGLYDYNPKIIDWIHVVIMSSLIISLLLDNLHISIVSIFVLISILVIWKINGRCIMYHSKKEEWGIFRGSEAAAYGTVLLLVVLHYIRMCDCD